MLNYRAEPTGAQFLMDRSFVKLICGPIGGGKSTVALFDLLNRSLAQEPFRGVRRTKHIILRNTMAQLKSTVKPLIDQWFVEMTEGVLGRWRLTDNTFEIRTRLPDDTIVHAEFVMLAADTPDDVRRLLSMEASSAWCEEFREVDPEVFEGLMGRVDRFPSRAAGGVTYPGVIGSTNPPPYGGYWHKVMTEVPDGWAVFMQPPALLPDGSINPGAENLRNLSPTYYEKLIAGKTQEWIDVYLRNEFGSGGFGLPVFRGSFRKDFHVVDSPLLPVMQTVNPLIVGMDNGLTAAAVLGQMDARGRVNILDECYVPEGETMGVESFLDKMLVPLMRSKYPFRPDNVLFSLDPACFQRSQVNEATIAQAVQARGYQVVQASTNNPERRISAVEGLLNRQADGGPGLAISPTCPWLTAALSWGYRYKKQSNGQFTPTVEKNHYSHIAEALQYLCLHYNMQLDPMQSMLTPRRREVSRTPYRWT